MQLPSWTLRENRQTSPAHSSRTIGRVEVATVAVLLGLVGSPTGAVGAVGAAVAAESAAATNVVEAANAVAGPYTTTTSAVTDAAGKVIYSLYYPSHYAALGFDSPIVTWGNGTNATPTMYSTLLGHFASHGFTVIASTLANTGSGNAIAAAARYLVGQNEAPGSVFYHRLDVDRVAAVGHSQGAGGATRATVNNPALIAALMVFSLPNTRWVAANPDCPTTSDCMFDPRRLTRPVFFVSTYGPLDGVIASPSTETAFYNSVPGRAVLGIVKKTAGKNADHNSVQNVANGGNPAGQLGYATAWLKYQLLDDADAAAAFSGQLPEIVPNTNWPGAAVK